MASLNNKLEGETATTTQTLDYTTNKFGIKQAQLQSEPTKEELLTILAEIKIIAKEVLTTIKQSNF